MAGLVSPSGLSNDLTLLDKIDSESVVEILDKRFQTGSPYTYIGEVVVSINPYRQLNIYGNEVINEYRAREMWEKQPHIFALAESVHQTIKRQGKNACVIITGESGSGKTEASKIVMKYLAAVSSQNDKAEIERVRDILLRTNVILESFGNARTGRNDNSSRFGKYMDISFDFKGTPNGGNIHSYLLEKSRVVQRSAGERNFHSFYQLLAGANDQLLTSLSLKRSIAGYRYTKGDDSQAMKVGSGPGTDDRKLFKDVEMAMKNVGFQDHEIKSIWRLMSAILHLGNVDFHDDDDSAAISNETDLARVAKLLDVDLEAIKDALTSRTVSAGGDIISAKHSAEKAEHGRDGFAKAIYERLFSFIVGKINSKIQVDKRHTDCVIGVLDIYGFEVLGINSFEQLCINYANEMLQQLFIQLVLKQQQEEYIRENISWVDVQYHNNQPICELVEGRRGMLALLEDAAGGGLGKATDDGLLETLDSQFKANKFYTSRRNEPQDKTLEHGHQFRIRHYAGDVTYSITGFIDKSKDLVFQDFKRLLFSSKQPAISSMWKDGAQAKSIVTKRPPAAGTLFKQSMQELIKNLSSKEPFYIRCIKPNEIKSPQRFDTNRVAHQVAYLGLVENIRVRKAGFAVRQPYDRFLQRYKLICKETWPNHRLGNDKKAVEVLCNSMKIKKDEDVAYGNTKLFIRSAKTLNLLEARREVKIVDVIIFLQKHWRRTLAQIRYKKMRALMTIIEYYRKYKLRKYISDLEKKFRNVRQMPDKGKSITWGAPPKSIVSTVDYFKIVFRRWCAHFVISRLPKEEHEGVKMRAAILDSYIGSGRQGWQGGEWKTDYINNPEFNMAVSTLRTKEKEGLGKLLFAAEGIKLSSKAKGTPRAVLITDKFVLKMDSTKKYKVMDKKSVSETIKSVSVFSEPTSKSVVLHCEGRNDLVMAFNTGNPVELTAILRYKLNVEKVNVQSRIPITVEKKSSNLTREASIDESASFQKRGNDVSVLD